MPAKHAGPKHHADRPRGSVRQRGRHVSSYADGFGRFAGITTLALVPGAGLLATGRRRLGLLILLLAVGVLTLLGLVAASGDVVDRVLALAVNPNDLLLIAVAVIGIGLLWCLTIVVTALRARPERPSPFQGVVGLVLVLSLCLTVAAPSAKGAQLALVQRDLVTSVFDNGNAAPAAAGAVKPATEEKNPWAGIPRVNLLLLGSDAGADRTGVRTDSMMVASVNTKTGNTTLIGIPRSLQKVPFPESNPLHAVWPNGFNCGSDCLMNAVWDQAAAAHANLFKGQKNPGLTTTREVISEITGLRIDAYVIIDLNGFKSLVNAMGGVEVNVPRRIPIGGGYYEGTTRERPITGWIEPGRKRLTGYQALWFSRSRSGSDDYDRMLRQRCMVGNLVEQVNPVKLLGKYTQLADVLKHNVQTDVAQDQLQAWTVLVKRMQAGRISSLPLTKDVINTVNPDFDQMRAFIKSSLNPVPATPASTPPTGTTTTSPGAQQPTQTKPSSSGAAQNNAEVC